MISYILKRDSDNNLILVRRVDGQVSDAKVIYDRELIAHLFLRGLIESEHIILHYAMMECEELLKIIKGN